MAVYRYILEIPPTAKVVTAEKQKTAYRQNITAVLHYRRKNIDIFWFYRFRQKNTANSRYHQKVPPTLNTAKRVPPTLDTAQKVPATLDIAQKVPPILHTAQRDHLHWIPPKKYRLFFPWVASTFWGFGVGGALTAYARRHARVEATSCQAARNFSALAHLIGDLRSCLLYTSPSPRDATLSRMPSSA